MSSWWGIALTVIFTAIAAPSQAAEPRKLDVPANRRWQHAATELIVPPSLGGFQRTQIDDNTDQELDIIVQFRESENERLTLYIYRPPLANLPVWFDRSETQILSSATFGEAIAASDIMPFASPNATKRNSLRRLYTPSKPPFLSTGLALLPLGNWMLGIRISSTTLDAGALDRKLLEVIGGLGFPQRTIEGQTEEPAPIQPCLDSLPFAKKARLRKPDMTMAIIGAAMASIPYNEDKEKTESNVELCREGVSEKVKAVYREKSGKKGYIIALADSGRSIEVDPLIGILASSPGYSVTFYDLATSFVYPQFDKLPPPDQVLNMVLGTDAISSRPLGEDTKSIGLKPD